MDKLGLNWEKMPTNKFKLFSIISDIKYNTSSPTGFQLYCDWCIGKRWGPPNKCWGDPTILPKTIYVACCAIRFFYTKIYPHLPDNHKYVLLLGDEDYTIPINIDLRSPKNAAMDTIMWDNFINNKNILHIFVSNLMIAPSERYTALTNGFTPYEIPGGNLDSYLDLLDSVNYNINCRNNRILCTTRVRQGPQWADRAKVVDLALNSSWQYFTDRKSIEPGLYSQELQKYNFVLLPKGGGIEANPNLFQAVLHGVIPICKKFINYDKMYGDLPVVWLDEWEEEEISPYKLKQWKDKFRIFFTDKQHRNKSFEIFYCDYYVKQVQQYLR